MKISLAKGGYEYNVVIIFTDNGGKLVDALRVRGDSFFNNLSDEKERWIFKSRKPIRWWYNTEVTGSDGEKLIDGELHRTNSSLISSGVKIQMLSAFVIVDVGLCEGCPLESIASYVSMISFAQIKNEDRKLAVVDSILGMFSREGPRLNAFQTLTVWDRAYLRALYQIPPDRPLWQQRTRLAGAMINAIVEHQGK